MESGKDIYIQATRVCESNKDFPVLKNGLGNRPSFTEAPTWLKPTECRELLSYGRSPPHVDCGPDQRERHSVGVRLEKAASTSSVVSMGRSTFDSKSETICPSRA